MLHLSFGISFHDLYETNGLKKVDNIFLDWLYKRDQASQKLHNLIVHKRTISHQVTQVLIDEQVKAELNSQEIIEIAKNLEIFLAELFGIKTELAEAKLKLNVLRQILQCRKTFIQKRVLKQEEISTAQLQETLATLREKGLDDPDDEQKFASLTLEWLDQDEEEALKAAAVYANYRIYNSDNKVAHNLDKSILFSIPQKLDHNNLIPNLIRDKGDDTCLSLPLSEIRGRDNFRYDDYERTSKQAQKHAVYCIYCHNRQKDSCSHGFINKETNQPLLNPLGVDLHGCPLREKISEMNWLRANDYIISALIVAALDNPMLAATGHRICNDCMKSCIYQKQEPVNIPLVETQVLDQVLELPWGFEIYSLLTRWNPLNIKQPFPLDDQDQRVLVVGLGPAGFTLAHYLLNSGITVVGIDGTKIEALPHALENMNFTPIRNIKEFFINLEERTPQGFGGVMEYGITVRWQKNYLTIIRLLLERRTNFRMFGGIRFGSQVTFSNVQELGFDHVALALGAGRPNIPDLQNNFAKGVRTASDFLMALQLTGAGHHSSLTNLQLRLPVVIIGSGLTAIDTATESLAYYCVQVEKFARYFELLGPGIFDTLNEEEIEIIQEFIKHGQEIRSIKNSTKAELRPDYLSKRIAALLRSWGGATILYRKKLQHSPAYRINHEEMSKGFEQGIRFIESSIPVAIETNKDDHCLGIHYLISATEDSISQETRYIEAKSIFIAAGTNPNTVIAQEDKLTNELLSEKENTANNQYFTFAQGKSFLIHSIANLNSNSLVVDKLLKEHGVNGDYKGIKSFFPIGISCFGDLHRKYAGNVVKAMASAKDGYKEIIEDLKLSSQNKKSSTKEEFFKKLETNFIAKIQKINILAPNIVELIVQAPLAAKKFQPGQFFRLQNYATSKVPLIEGIALTGASCEKDNISLILLEIGTSTKLCRYLEVGEKVVLMGPTGSPTEIPQNENVLLIGGGLGNAVLFSIGKAMKDKGCKVLYFAGYRSLKDRYKADEIEKAADQVVWCCEEGLLAINRNNDITFQGNILESLNRYGTIEKAKLAQIDRIVVIGSAGLMEAVTKWFYYDNGKKLLPENCKLIASINSPMQCMMKEICGQCLQRQVDKNGNETYVYSCFNQDQNAFEVDFCFLKQRLSQNSLQEKIGVKLIKSGLLKQYINT